MIIKAQRAIAGGLAKARARRVIGHDWRDFLEALPFLTPWLVGVVFLEMGPIIASGVLSLFDWDLIGKPRWTGIGNYTELFFDDFRFWQALKVTFYYGLVAVPLRLVAAFTVALLMNQKVPGISVLRTVYYTPSVVSGVAVALLWYWIFNSQFGLINYLLGLVGIQGPDWLMNPTWVMPALIFMSLWGIGGPMIIFLAGLQGVPQPLYDAAMVDGAGRLRRFLCVTWPMMTPVVFFNLVQGIIASLQTFNNAFVITGGGPGNATLFYVLYLYRNAFLFFRMGKACALAWVLFVIILLLTVMVFRSSALWVFYEVGIERKGG